jgi:hypothetical protein
MTAIRVAGATGRTGGAVLDGVDVLIDYTSHQAVTARELAERPSALLAEG